MKDIEYNKEKAKFLLKTRKIDLKIIREMIIFWDYIDIIPHPKKDNQSFFIFNIDNYIVLVPFVEDKKKIFLKTAF